MDRSTVKLLKVFIHRLLDSVLPCIIASGYFSSPATSWFINSVYRYDVLWVLVFLSANALTGYKNPKHFKPKSCIPLSHETNTIRLLSMLWLFKLKLCKSLILISSNGDFQFCGKPGSLKLKTKIFITCKNIKSSRRNDDCRLISYFVHLMLTFLRRCDLLMIWSLPYTCLDNFVFHAIK